MIPWWVLKPACDLLEAVINRVSPIQGAQVEAHRRAAAFHALEVFEEENELFPGEQDGLDWMLSWPERQPDLKAMNITRVLAWMQEHRTTDVVVQCGYCNRVIGDLKKWAAHLMVCDPDDVVPDSATVAASAATSSADAGDNSPEEGTVPPAEPSSGHSKDYRAESDAIITAFNEAEERRMQLALAMFQAVRDHGHEDIELTDFDGTWLDVVDALKDHYVITPKRSVAG